MTIVTAMGTKCPNCRRKGKTVKALTLRALLKEEFTGQVVDADYRFCSAKGCEIVYYGNGQTFAKPQRREEFKKRIMRWFALGDKPRTDVVQHRHAYAPNPNLLIIDPHAEILKGLA